MLHFIRSLSRDERGVSALEYAILAGIVVAALVTAGAVLKGDGTTTGIGGLFTSLIKQVTTTINGS